MGDADESSRKPIAIKVFGRTDVGLVREHNEDNFLVAELKTGNRSLLPEVREHEIAAEGTLLAVCDGMGGAAAGEVASQMAVDTIFDIMQGEEPPEDVETVAKRLDQAVLDAGKKIYDSAKADRSRRGMGTTVTAAALIDERMVFAQVGDSRGYVVRDGEMVQVTRDQSLVNQLIEAGQLKPEEAELFEHSNIILQALGTAEDVTVDLTYVDLRKGDIVMMCSDGLSGLVTDDQICEIINNEEEPIDACKALTEAAREGGGHDNITVIIAQFDGEGLAGADGEEVEFRRLEIPGKPSFPQRQQGAAAGGWSQTGGGDGRGDDDSRDSGTGARASEADDFGEGESNPYWMVIAIVLVLAVGVGLGYLIMSGALSSEAPDPPAPALLDDAAPAAVKCLFRSDAPGTLLLIDDQDYGVLPDHGLTKSLPPAIYTIEARNGEITKLFDMTVTAGQQECVVSLALAEMLAAAARDAGAATADADIALADDGGLDADAVEADAAAADGDIAEAIDAGLEPAAPDPGVQPQPEALPDASGPAAPPTKQPRPRKRVGSRDGRIEANPFQ